ncbi:uncharacterized protein LOC125950123 isoform X2 [Anopheles darlingi]|uniref:uncharacterized protein LOC125950123 isoform X2 n=1 Tax=Anopheles darlingi TaxID=43151 RepID=UPI0021005B6A|nr:uncharacterized protein LOC125950123 isoform X2 [Anopheles darlingi]
MKIVSRDSTQQCIIVRYAQLSDSVSQYRSNLLRQSVLPVHHLNVPLLCAHDSHRLEVKQQQQASLKHPVRHLVSPSVIQVVWLVSGCRAAVSCMVEVLCCNTLHLRILHHSPAALRAIISFPKHPIEMNKSMAMSLPMLEALFVRHASWGILRIILETINRQQSTNLTLTDL